MEEVLFTDELRGRILVLEYNRDENKKNNEKYALTKESTLKDCNMINTFL